MTLQQLYGNLLIYELELSQRADTTSDAKRKEKGVALKTSQLTNKDEDSKTESKEELDDSLVMLAKNLKKFILKNRRFRPRK